MTKELKVEKKRVSILGCGWLGFALAQRLVKLDITSELNGSTTSVDKLALFEAKGIKGYLLELTPGFSAGLRLLTSFFNVDLLVVSLPPRSGKNEKGFYIKQIEAVITQIRKSAVKDIIFISSTGVYPDLNRIITEEDVVTPAESASPEMVGAEQLLLSLRPAKKVTILRMGGLIGYNRIPGKYVTGKKDMPTGLLPVNYLHPDDACDIMITILKNGIADETFNVVAPLHPTRREVYESSCAQFGWEPPTFLEPEIRPDFKVISAEKFTLFYPYQFKYPDPLKFYYDPAAAPS